MGTIPIPLTTAAVVVAYPLLTAAQKAARESPSRGFVVGDVPGRGVVPQVEPDPLHLSVVQVNGFTVDPLVPVEPGVWVRLVVGLGEDYPQQADDDGGRSGYRRRQRGVAHASNHTTMS